MEVHVLPPQHAGIHPDGELEKATAELNAAKDELVDPNAKVTPEQADELERRVKETNSSVTAFLKFANAKTFAEIPANKYDELDRMLAQKERAGR